MDIKILFDSNTLDEKLSTGWGISYLINDRILFDTGEKPNLLLNNIHGMNVKVSCIESVVISHDHWDHTGGLWGLLERNSKLNIYSCPGFSEEFKNKVKSYTDNLIEAKEFRQICKDIYTTGEIDDRYDSSHIAEQALVLKTNKGLIVITGCAHPGIFKIIENVKQNIFGNIYLVLGGFHLMGKHRRTVRLIADGFKKLGIQNVAPSHCTGGNAINIFKEKYKDSFIDVNIGQIIGV